MEPYRQLQNQTKQAVNNHVMNKYIYIYTHKYTIHTSVYINYYKSITIELRLERHTVQCCVE